MTDITFDGYSEFIEEFIFREKAALTIPKRIREAAYAMQIDIEIVSTDGNDYINSKSSPAYGFYGYAVLVMRDHSEIQIPIAQPRQVLYYGRVPEAFANWYSLYLAYVGIATQYAVAEGLIVPIGVELGLSVATQPLFCPTTPPWQELPIREVYIKCRRGTQFNVEVTWTEPVPVAYGECSYDGKSQQTDDEKDGGLPPEGTQPQNASDPTFPYAGLPSPSSAEELGDFFNLKQGSLDNPNPGNEPDLGGEIYWVAVRHEVSRPEFPDGCASKRIQILYYELLDSSVRGSVLPFGTPFDTGCNGRFTTGWQLQLTGGEPFLIGNSDTTPSLSYDSGDAVPANELYFE